MIDWLSIPRQDIALPCEMVVLERYATQPANHRSRKPARLIWLYTLGKSREEILDDLRISEEKIEEYFEQWIDGGVCAMTKAFHPGMYSEYETPSNQRVQATCPAAPSGVGFQQLSLWSVARS